MTAAATAPAAVVHLPPEGKAALRAGVVGNWIDNIHVFLPLTALAPAMLVLAGPAAAASTGALIVIAMLLGRPIGGVVFGRIADRLGRTRTTRIAIAGTALCALAIAATPTHEILGAGTIGLILSMAPWAQATIAFSVAGLLALIGPDAYAAWGWRLLFVLGALLSVGMLVYYSRQVTDAPVFHRSKQRTEQAKQAERAGQAEEAESVEQAKPAGRPGLRQLLAGRWARAFWQVFVLMTGLWLLTNTTVLLLTDRLATDSALDPTAVPVVMGIASVAQAVVMALAGHLSTRVGRRRVFVLWGLAAAIAGPVVWWLAVHSPTLATAAACATVLQVITVSAYGPVSAYLSERFPTEIRSTGYGSGYSLSLIIPALYPFYLPALEAGLGRHGSVMALVVLGGVLLVLGAALGPKLAPRDLDGDLDEVAAGAVGTGGNR